MTGCYSLFAGYISLHAAVTHVFVDCDSFFSHAAATDWFFGEQTFQWQVRIFGFYDLKGMLDAEISRKQVSSCQVRDSCACVSITTSLNEIRLNEASPFQELFTKVMRHDPFNCGNCQLDATICGSTREEDALKIHDLQLSGENVSVADKSQFFSSKQGSISLRVSRFDLGINFNHLGVKGELLHSILGDEIAINIFK